MPATETDGVRIHYCLSGHEDGELLVLSNSLGSSLQMWDKVLALLETRYRLLRYDARGHGTSSVPRGPYTLDQLGCDVLNLMNEIGAERVNFCGLSLGGMTGMWLALHEPQRVNRLILANTASRIGTPEIWENRIATVRASGMDSLAVQTIGRWFTSQYQESHQDEMKQIATMIATTNLEGYCSSCAILRDADLSAQISSISVPTLVIAATHDPATPPSEGRAVAAAVRGAQYTELDASHLSAWERADEFANAVFQFLAKE